MRRAAAPVVALAVALGGCGSGDKPPLVWQGTPVVVRQPQLPDDTIVSGKVRNASGSRLELDAAKVSVVGADGHAVRSTIRFSTGVTHGLYPPRDAPSPEPRFLRQRLGEIATVEPGASVPLVVSWRVPHGAQQPVSVRLGSLTLRLPRGQPPLQ